MPKTPLAEQAGNAGKHKASEALSRPVASIAGDVSQQRHRENAPRTSPAPARALPDPNKGAGFDTFIAGALIVAFLVYITAKGELGTYLQLFLYTPPASGSTASGAMGGAQQGSPSGSTPVTPFQEGQPVAGAASAFQSFLKLLQNSSGGPAN